MACLPHELVESLDATHVVVESPLDPEESLLLSGEIQSFLTLFINSLKRVASAQSLKRLLTFLEGRMSTSQQLGGYLSCLPFLLRYLRDIHDAWLHLEEEAQPRTPLAQISATEIELDATKEQLVHEASERENAINRQVDLRANVTFLKDEIACIEKRREELWKEHQRLGEELAWRNWLITKHEAEIVEDRDRVLELDVSLECKEERKTSLEDSLLSLQTSKLADSEAVRKLDALRGDFVTLKGQLIPMLETLRDRDSLL